MVESTELWGFFRKYYHMARVTSSGEVRVDEVLVAKAFCLEKLLPLRLENPTISQRDIQRRLVNWGKCAETAQSSSVRQCLRCYVSNELKLACQNLVQRFTSSHAHCHSHEDFYSDLKVQGLDQIVDPLRGQHHDQLTEKDLFPLVLDGFGRSIQKSAKSEQQYISLTDEILDTFEPIKGSLSTWTSQLFKTNKNVKQVMREHGIELVTDWLLLSNTKPRKLSQILEDYTSSVQEVE